MSVEAKQAEGSRKARAIECGSIVKDRNRGQARRGGTTLNGGRWTPVVSVGKKSSRASRDPRRRLLCSIVVAYRGRKSFRAESDGSI